MEEEQKYCEEHNTYHTDKCHICELEEINEKINTIDILIGTILTIIITTVSVIIFGFILFLG